MRRHTHTHAERDRCVCVASAYILHLYRLNFSCRKSLAAQTHHTHTITCCSPHMASLAASLLPPPSPLPIPAYCAHVKSNKFNNAYTYGMKAAHTHTHAATLGLYEVTHTPSGTPNSCAAAWLPLPPLSLSPACFPHCFRRGMPQDASARPQRSAERRRCLV